MASQNGAGRIEVSRAGEISADGNPGDGDFTLAIIAARGQAGLSATARTDVAIKSLFVGGRVEQAQILAGYLSTQFLTPTNADAQIGTIFIGGDLIASSIIAGVTTPAQQFGALTLGGTKIPFKAGASNDLFSLERHIGATRGATTDGYDFHAFEVA